MNTDEKNLAQYHYIVQCHLENWISGKQHTINDEGGREVPDVAGAIVKEI